MSNSSSPSGKGIFAAATADESAEAVLEESELDPREAETAEAVREITEAAGLGESCLSKLETFKTEVPAAEVAS